MVVLTPRKERGVNIDQVEAFAWQLPHNVQVVTPEELIGFEFRMAEGDPLDYLKREIDSGEEFAEALTPVPA